MTVKGNGYLNGSARPLTIGGLAREAGVHVETVRYYERRGLLKQPASRNGAFRIYPTEALRQLRAIKHLQAVGFSLEEIRELLALRQDERVKCGDVLARVEAKLDEVEGAIENLVAIKSFLQKTISAAPGKVLPASECPILDVLEKRSAERVSNESFGRRRAESLRSDRPRRAKRRIAY